MLLLLINTVLQANSTGTLSSQSGQVMVLSRVEAARKYFRTVYGERRGPLCVHCVGAVLTLA